MKTPIWLFLAFTAGLFIGALSSRLRGGVRFQNRGEALVSRKILQAFGAPDYHLLSHVTMALPDGTTQIDHILVSRFGVFVIEVKDYKGWIFAHGQQREWTQVLFNGKFKFQNPIFQNLRHVRAVRELLDFLPAEEVHSLVVFAGEAEFKTEVPQGVYKVDEFLDHLRQQTTPVMSANRMQFCVGRLETHRLAISGQTDVEHVESLARRHGRRP